MSRLIAALLKAYRLVVSQLYLQTCRYYPSCSAYAIGSVETHGALRGVWLALRRLGRCHPWCAGGVDLVPTPENYRWWGRAAGTDGEDHDVSHETTPNHVPNVPACRGA
ncbi:membrane protein insertion efficiency factor YidD [Actinobacteria bacterium YIM 96077]|uniref:Putative membrane protein insertion efficiency factor n=1 Tax=Phytoactinopolyspora halophila TaxID=1981511 RepID=A0A329QQR7_9ACTN|nr:membrane protein insertion efficiency factor YidD [Phytoactinopolyspora halophila]AYY15109.1 membrane protein insertion efficiency factor YidD [Actinobacteria bacterium YIM 96077]RAW14710.1 membrane protein insertion efficiency factor YidD [Phytoactinopolyspora halophila]